MLLYDLPSQNELYSLMTLKDQSYNYTLMYTTPCIFQNTFMSILFEHRPDLLKKAGTYYHPHLIDTDMRDITYPILDHLTW